MTDLRRSLRGSDRLMVLAPHPDDETLACGGVLQWATRVGAAVRVVYLTDGENNPWAQRASERRWRLSDHDQRRWGERRRAEALAALAQLGIGPSATRFLGLRDQGLTECLVGDLENSVGRLHELLMRWRPTILIAPLMEDRHPDHAATGILARLALAACPFRPRQFGYRVHPRALAPGDSRDAMLVLTPEERETKRLAVLRHSSQLVLRREFLVGFAAGVECFATAAAARPPSHPVRHVRAGDGGIQFTIRRTARGAVGGAVLLVIAARDERATMIRVPLAGAAPPGVSRNGSHGPASIRRDGRELRVTIAMAGLESAARVLVKLDLPRERRLGLFDAWPWLDLALPGVRRMRPPEAGDGFPGARVADAAPAPPVQPLEPVLPETRS